MSAKQANKKIPIILSVVAVMLVFVVYLNLQTFGVIGDNKTSRGYRVQAHPPVPSDLGQFASHEAQPEVAWSMTGASAELLIRDPFFPQQSQPVPVVMATQKKPTRKAVPRKRTKSLQCSAIMLGGKSPMAIIDGEGRHIGDSIRGMVLTKIDADGLTFRRSNGTAKYLPIGVQEDDENNYRVVTRTRNNNDQGRTSLQGQ